MSGGVTSELGEGPDGRFRLVVVGGGFTGAVLAINAIRASAHRLAIVMVEPAAELGRGIAYGTRDPAHRINVPTDRMGLFEADPTQATRWFHEHGILPDPASDAGDGRFYVSRQAYGAFVADVLRQTVAAAGERVAFEHRRTTASALAHRDGVWVVTLADGSRVAADLVALCFGHAVPGLPCPLDAAVRTDRKFVLDPWAPEALGAIEPSDAVLIVGTGLTMADVVLGLREKGHRGPITAVSRRGLLPRRHGSFVSTIDILDGEAVPTTALELLRLIRRRVRRDGPAFGGWHALVDALRFKLPLIWSHLPPREKKRVLRRLLPFWEVHRFRIAPQVATALDNAMRASTLTVEKAGLTGLTRSDGGIAASLRPPGGRAESRTFDAVVLCTGPEKDLGANPLVAALLAEDIARLDALDLGLAVDAHSHVLDRDGRASSDLLAFGPMTRGSFGEMTGAPDIAAHIERQATRLFGTGRPADEERR